MTILEGNIFDQKEGIILEQVNCRGVHASGLAAQMNKVYPQVLEAYKKDCHFYKQKYLFGSVTWVKIDNDLTIGCCFGQDDYGTHKRQTNYGAISSCLYHVADRVRGSQEEVHIPWLMSCGLAGGSWDIVSEMIDFYLPNAKVWKLPQNKPCSMGPHCDIC